MNGSEKILAGFIAILVLIVMALSIKLLNTKESIGEKERELNRIHKTRITNYENQINTTRKIIRKLQAENEELTKRKQRVKVVTIREIDSVSALPFIEQANFWATEITRFDSIRERYVGRDNKKGL